MDWSNEYDRVISSFLEWFIPAFDWKKWLNYYLLMSAASDLIAGIDWGCDLLVKLGIDIATKPRDSWSLMVGFGWIKVHFSGGF